MNTVGIKRVNIKFNIEDEVLFLTVENIKSIILNPSRWVKDSKSYPLRM